MPIIETKLDSRAEAFRANTEVALTLVADLKQKIAVLALGGGEEARNKKEVFKRLQIVFHDSHCEKLKILNQIRTLRLYKIKNLQQTRRKLVLPPLAPSKKNYQRQVDPSENEKME